VAVGILALGSCVLGGPGSFGILALTAAAAFCLGLFLLERLLRFDLPLLAVASVLLKEALRRRIAIICGGTLVVALALLPLIISGDKPLHHRVQMYLSYGLALTGFLLILQSVILSCATLSHEIRNRQAFLTLVKPVGRGTYLLGKLLGVLLLNAILLLVAGGVIAAACRIQMARASSPEEKQRVLDEVLIARGNVAPSCPKLDGVLGDEVRRLREEGKDREIDPKRIKHQLIASLRNVPPGGSREYLFQGLSPLVRMEDVTLRMRVKMRTLTIGEYARLRVHLGQDKQEITSSLDEVHEIPLRDEHLTRDRLLVRVENLGGSEYSRFESSVWFPAGGLEILYRAGGFGSNLARALLILWIKAAFLSALGLLAASFLGFPVACMAVSLVAITASMSGFILESGRTFHQFEGQVEPVEEKEVSVGEKLWDDFKSIGVGFAWILEKYARYSPRERVVDGRLVSWGEVEACLCWVGGLWCGAAAALGCAILRRRELAKVQV